MFFENMLINRKRDKLAKAEQESQQLHEKLSGLASRDAIHQIGNLIDTQERLHLGELVNRFDELYQRYWRQGAEMLPKGHQDTAESIVRAAKTHRDRYLSRENLLNFSMMKKPPRSESLDSQMFETTKIQDYASEYFSSRHGTQTRLTKNESTIGALVIRLESMVELGESVLKKVAESKAKTYGRDKAREVVLNRLTSEVSHKISLLKVELQIKNSQLLTSTERVYPQNNSRLYRAVEKKEPPVQDPVDQEEYRFKSNHKASPNEVKQIVARLYKVKPHPKAPESADPTNRSPKVRIDRQINPKTANRSKPSKRSFEADASLRLSSYFAGHVSEKSFEDTESDRSSHEQKSSLESSRGLKPLDKLRAAVDRIRNKQSAIERTGSDIRQSICVTDPTALMKQLEKISSDFSMLKKTQGLASE